MINPPQSILDLRKKYKDLTNKEKSVYTKNHENKKRKNKQDDAGIQESGD